MDSLFSEIKEINFRRKKTPLSADMRPVFKISQIILVLHLSCYNNSASLIKLHFFNWIFKSKDHFNTLENFKENRFPIIRFDPSLNRAITYAVAENILEINNNNKKIVLTVKGQILVERLLKDENCLKDEKELLNKVKKKVSEAYLEAIFRERYQFDE